MKGLAAAAAGPDIDGHDCPDGLLLNVVVSRGRIWRWCFRGCCPWVAASEVAAWCVGLRCAAMGGGFQVLPGWRLPRAAWLAASRGAAWLALSMAAMGGGFRGAAWVACSEVLSMVWWLPMVACYRGLLQRWGLYSQGVRTGRHWPRVPHRRVLTARLSHSPRLHRGCRRGFGFEVSVRSMRGLGPSRRAIPYYDS